MALLNDIFGSNDSEAQKYLQQALQQFQNVQTPSTEAEKINNLPQETVQGVVTPEQIQTTDQGNTEFNNIALDPTSREAIVKALGGFQDISDSGGLDANAKLGIQQVIDAANNQSRGAQGAIQQQAQAQGQGGGDFALTQRAIAAQGASNNAATQGLQQAAEAEANREAALANMSTIGGNLNASDFNQAAARANAQDVINASNVAAKNAASTNNVANNMTGQQFNVSNAQGVNAANTAANQNKAYYNANLPQQQFNNELAKATGAAGVNANQATAAQQAAANNSAMWGSLIGAGGRIGGAALAGPAGAAAGGALADTVAPHTNATIASTPGYKTNATNVQPLATGGVVCYAEGGVSMPHDHTICMRMGGHVGGEPTVEGDSVQNDTVPAMLSPGELVIPRSVPKTGPAMEEFARQAPVNGDPKKRVNLAEFTKNYKRSR